MFENIPEYPNALHGVTLEGGGLVVGYPLVEKTRDGLNFFGIRTPRMVQLTKEGMFFAEMIGTPEECRFTKPPIFFYEIKDPQVIKFFAESTSKIKVTSNVPTYTGPTRVK